VCAFAIGFGLWDYFAQPVKRPVLLLLPSFFGFLAWLSCERCRKRADDFAKSVYDLFVSSVAAKATA
jgi:hypothetical protein